jgi:hypothetical protein
VQDGAVSPPSAAGAKTADEKELPAGWDGGPDEATEPDPSWSPTATFPPADDLDSVRNWWGD